MCLAKAYVRSSAGSPGASLVMENLVMENVTHVEVDGDQVRIKSLFGDAEVLRGRIASIDFSESRLVLLSLEA
jgi:predicted RNA-binding protein